MIRQSRLSRTRALALAAATAGLAAPLLAFAGSAQAAQAAGASSQAASGKAASAAAVREEAALTCTMRTAPKNPIAFTPALRDAAAQQVKGQGVVLLEGCTSPNGKVTDIASGRLEVSGTATANCRGVADLSATGTVTWRDAQGQVVGTSQLTAEHKGAASLHDSLLQGDVVSGRLKGRHFSGSATMTSDLRDCTAPSGFTQLTGSGKMSFA
ncbi:hypothetical protein [Nonomuraea pusilla]|uniref:Uncharacterized protein n=1 Tax=Nonomuraea pusilla TaxID=46177 RepID=A0A1H7Z489_9ACTN|nr:hypothetical protein [Nonomuraea pusilla]SEM53033.1 hypothetical protein SAMN05660976_05392 [Nonomuraea pusilla]